MDQQGQRTAGHRRKRVPEGEGSRETMTAPRDPLDRLTEDNENNIAQLTVLAVAAQSIKMSGFSAVAFGHIAESMRSIEARFYRHNEQEETFLLPLVDRHNAGMQQILRKEHREVAHAVVRMMTTIRNIEEGRIHGTSIAELVSTAETIVDLLRVHIVKENTMLFPRVRTMLSPEEYRHLQQQLCQ